MIKEESISKIIPKLNKDHTCASEVRNITLKCNSVSRNKY